MELETLRLDAVGLEEYVDELARRAAQEISSGTHVTITLRRPGGAATLAASDVRAAMCDRVVYDSKAGPCLTAIAEGSPVVLPDLATDQRWPGWRDTAAAQGFRASASVPAKVTDGIAVSLNLYSEDPRRWSEQALAHARQNAEEVSRTLRLCVRSVERATMDLDLRATVAARATIHQAIGVIMAENRCSSQDAVRILRSASQHRNVELRDVAAAVIEGITGIAPLPLEDFHDEPQ